MRRVMVRYTVKPGQEAVNEKLARAVYDELHQTQPAGLQYATFRLDDGRTFVHVAFDETPARPPRAVHPLHRARTAIVITDSITALPGAPEPAVQQHERVTWVLSRHDGHWLVEAYHSCPKHAGVQ